MNSGLLSTTAISGFTTGELAALTSTQAAGLTSAQVGALSTAEEIAEHDAVDGVLERTPRVFLKFDPIEISRPGLIRRIHTFHN